MSVPKGNPSNLNPVQTKQEARERGKKGGIKSGEARRKKRDAKESAKLFLEMAATGQLDQYLEQFGVKRQERTNMMGIIARQIDKAQSGDEKSVRLIFELSGDITKQGVDMTVNIENASKDPYDGLTVEELRRLAVMAGDDNGEKT